MQTLRLEKNRELEDLGMPNLMNISMDSLFSDMRLFVTSIYDNPQLCVPVHQIGSWLLSGRVFLPRMFYCGIEIIEDGMFYKKFKVENSSKIYCSMDWFNSSMPLGCQVIDSGIWMIYEMNVTRTDYFSRAIESVEYIYGPVIIRNTTLKRLNFSSLKTIYNTKYDLAEDAKGWGFQVMEFEENYFLTDIEFPKLERIFHYGYDPFIKMSNNNVLKCSTATCNVFLGLYRFELDSCSCGIIPTFNEGYDKTFLVFTIVEATCCAVFTIIIYGNIMFNLYKARSSSLSNFQFSTLVYYCLSCMESVYNVLNNVKFNDGLGYPWFIGLQFLFVSNKEKYFYQAVNIIYINRISLLLSCCLYRTISFVNFEYGKVAMGLSFFIFIVGNVWCFYELLKNGSQWAYGIFLINWTTFVVSITTSIFLFFHLRRNYKSYSELLNNQNKLSLAFFLQALFSFVFCGFPEGIFGLFPEKYSLNKLLRTQRIFDHSYGSIINRWHYLLYAVLLRIFLHDMLAKINIRADHLATAIRPTSAIAPAHQVHVIP